MRAVSRAGPVFLLASVAAFVVLEAAAMALYPGGTWWNTQATGASFWQNFLCDLEWAVALDGRPNPVGSRLAQAAMLVLVAGVGAFWWIAPAMFPSKARTGAAARALGLTSVAATVAVALMPSDRYGALHGIVVMLAAIPGLGAALVATAGLLGVGPCRSRERGRGPVRTCTGSSTAGFLGAGTLLASLLDAVLYARTMIRGGPGPTLLPVAQKVALLLLLAWMTTVALRVRR